MTLEFGVSDMRWYSHSERFQKCFQQIYIIIIIIIIVIVIIIILSWSALILASF